MPRRYALVKIAEIDDISLAEALDEYDAAFPSSISAEELAAHLRALLSE